jgi:hypothetical protein
MWSGRGGGSKRKDGRYKRSEQAKLPNARQTAKPADSRLLMESGYGEILPESSSAQMVAPAKRR